MQLVIYDIYVRGRMIVITSYTAFDCPHTAVFADIH